MDDSETIKEILKSTSLTRDALPYTAEFDTLHDTYIKTCGTIDKHDFQKSATSSTHQRLAIGHLPKQEFSICHLKNFLDTER